MVESKKNKNLELLFNEVHNQFKYSSDLFDNLDNKSNTLIIFITIILVVCFNSYFLEKIDTFSWGILICFFIGISLIITSILRYVFTLRRRKFRIIDLESLKKIYIDDPKRNLYKVLSDRYIKYIDEILDNYEEKEDELAKALVLLRIGFLVLIVVFVFVILISKLGG